MMQAVFTVHRHTLERQVVEDQAVRQVCTIAQERSCTSQKDCLICAGNKADNASLLEVV